MTPPDSLSSFFEKNTTTLNNCDREPIHLSGKIQSLGALLVIDPKSLEIIGASENAAAFLGFTGDSLLNVPLRHIDDALTEQVTEIANDGQILHQILDFEIRKSDVSYDCIAHIHGNKVIVEFVPNTLESAKAVRTTMRKCSRACSRVLQSDSFQEALQIAVDSIREITGFSRAKIYRFQSDWSGEVIAESSDGVLPSYKGLCFPAGDIPAQVREIMKIVPYRAIGTVSDECVALESKSLDVGELDLTWSILRSVSTMHTQYLRNIGVGCSFSCSLLSEGKLWGVIALHDDGETLLPFDIWGLVHEIGTALMLRLAQEERIEIANAITRLRVIESQFAAQLRHGGEIEEVIVGLVPELRTFLGADGFAFQYGNNMHLSGRTPPTEFIGQIIKWATKHTDQQNQFQTNALHTLLPEAEAHMDTACGVLIQPMAAHRVCQLIWFRGPMSRTVRWAGQPVDAAAKGTQDVLTPRHSFDQWVQEHNDQSAPWKADELRCAQEIFAEFLDIVASQLLLKQENADLRQFAATAAHDLKAPLRGINLALDWMSEDDFEPDAVKQTHAIAKRSSVRMTALTEGLLEFALVENQPMKNGPVALESLINHVQELLHVQLSENGATLTHSPLPTINCDQTTMLRVFMNLVANALKFRKQDVAPSIHVSSKTSENGDIELSVTDNGIGIAPKYAERIFRPLGRLHTQDEIEGSGLGLAICERIIKLHGGTIKLDQSYNEGARFEIVLPAAALAVI